jgi:hypothetical protein
MAHVCEHVFIVQGKSMLAHSLAGRSACMQPCQAVLLLLLFGVSLTVLHAALLQGFSLLLTNSPLHSNCFEPL